jgi:ubiquinone/menaquinone biosynthesis C-methylase UbiE
MSAPGEMLQHEKRAVPGEFDRVAHGYDLLSRLNPGYRRHLRWSARRLEAPPSASLLDLCCGTGLSTQALRTEHPTARLTGLDASAGMLDHAAAKPQLAGVTWIHGDATDPAQAGAAGPYDGILMAYGLRNVPDADRCLQNLFALLRPGGTLCLHEYSVAGSWRSRAVWQMVTVGIVIPLGWMVTRSTTIYRYLRRSVLAFDSVAQLEARLRRAGFTDVHTEPMDGWQRGVVHSFLARRPGP